jgi:predicted 3-demethylubiquinone-9 3-methyltransferase (glyoxalase superfamily)
MLDWLIRHDPALASATLASIVGRAQDRFGIPRQVTERTLGTALSLDGDLDDAARENFLQRVFAPDTTA